MRDVMGWNTIWDGVNHRPYITCSRNWDLKKFGGFGFWLNDTAVNALLVSLFDADQARENAWRRCFPRRRRRATCPAS